MFGSFILVFLSRLMEGHGQAGFHLTRWGGSIQLNNLESINIVLMFTSLQKMNDSVVQLKVQ